MDFEGTTYSFEDDRIGEQRFVTLGLLAGIPVSVVHTESNHEIRIFSFRKAAKRKSTSMQSKTDCGCLKAEENVPRKATVGHPEAEVRHVVRGIVRRGLQPLPSKASVSLRVDQDGIARALGDTARAKGMTQVAKDAGLSRESLYKALSENGNPTFSTVLKVAKALGVRLNAQPM